MSQIILKNHKLENKTLVHLQECLRHIIDRATTEAKYDLANIGLDIIT